MLCSLEEGLYLKWDLQKKLNQWYNSIYVPDVFFSLLFKLIIEHIRLERALTCCSTEWSQEVAQQDTRSTLVSMNQFCNSVESVQIWAVKPIDLLMILSPYLHGTSCIHHNAHQLEKTWLSYLLTCHTSVISIRASSSTICMIFEIYTLELLS